MIFSYILALIFSASTLSLAFTADPNGSAVMEGAQAAVSFCVGITGGICLWSGVMELMERCGITAALARLLRPVLTLLFPQSARHTEILAAITENVSANLLGLGNAATPSGIRAARGMAALSGSKTATDELCLFVVINTASVQLLPTTVAAVRAQYGAASPFDIVPAVWISSVISILSGLLVSALLRRIWA